MAYFEHSKPIFAQANVLKVFES